jgi:hypothetical protein
MSLDRFPINWKCTFRCSAQIIYLPFCFWRCHPELIGKFLSLKAAIHLLQAILLPCLLSHKLRDKRFSSFLHHLQTDFIIFPRSISCLNWSCRIQIFFHRRNNSTIDLLFWYMRYNARPRNFRNEWRLPLTYSRNRLY